MRQLAMFGAFVVACLSGIGLDGGCGAARAASVTSDDFAAVVGPSADYLAASSDLALTATNSRAVRAFAKAEGAEARTLAARLAEWRHAEAQAAMAAAAAPTLDRLGPLTSALSVPLEAIARTTAEPGFLFTRLPSAERLEEAGRTDLQRLAAVRGAAFDDLYVATDLAALRRLERVCRDFVLNGDDPTLRALAVDALPALRRRIAALARG